MDQRLLAVLREEYDASMCPFLWMHGNKRQISIRDQLTRLRRDGLRAVCVESRPHPDFCRDGWWRDMDELLSQAQLLGMKVWLFDDDHYPTGHANGAIARKHPSLCAVNIAETHADVMGPVQDGMLLVNRFAPEDEVLGVYAFRREEQSEDVLLDEAIDLSGRVRDGFIFVTLPEGCYRVFTIFRTRKSAIADYFDVLNPASVKVLLDEVYEPHYAHYKSYFGNVFAGFFSDEPRFKNQQIKPSKTYIGWYHHNIGQPGMGLPWNDALIPAMERHGFDKKALMYLPALWYNVQGVTPNFRYAYMDAVSRRYSTCFSVQVGNWCKAHGVQYIGHIIEDMDNHARVGDGPGHYFRSMVGQDMAGMDIVLHQVLPGFAHYDTMGMSGGYYTDSRFFHYVLAQLCASLSHIHPSMKGRAMCEVFGAYGWAEGVPMMKWLIDFLLVRGVNYFVPHAIADTFPDTDCPPHMGALGHDPQYDAFKTLVPYAEKLAFLLRDGRHIANAAILYHAEAEWMHNTDYMNMSSPARVLCDAHISYDIIPADILMESLQVKANKLLVQQEIYDCLIVPWAPTLPEGLLFALQGLIEKELPVVFLEALPSGIKQGALSIPLDVLPQYMQEQGFVDLTMPEGFPLLRHYHIKRGTADIWMLFNESATQEADVRVRFSSKGAYIAADIALNRMYRGVSQDGEVSATLTPYQSMVFIFDEFDPGFFDGIPSITAYTRVKEKMPDITFEVSVASYENLAAYRPIGNMHKLKSLNTQNGLEGFSGNIKYETTLYMKKPGRFCLDLGVVGETARLRLCGRDQGMRMCSPYAFDIELDKGENRVEIVVANTLANVERDPFSAPLLLHPSGLLGPIKLYRYVHHA